MNTRRPAHAAGDRWGKWEDPLLYGPTGGSPAPLPRRPWLPDLLIWVFALEIGIMAGLRYLGIGQ